MLAPRSGETMELKYMVIFVTHYCAPCLLHDINLSLSRAIALFVLQRCRHLSFFLKMFPLSTVLSLIVSEIFEHKIL